jgi:D-glycero-D-manno-heptose 1,7-bisphosphate phosphatase
MNMIILDRDGVINEDSDEYIKSPQEWIPIPGSLEAIALLNQHGFKVTVASNQSGLARGLFSVEALDQIHQKMQQSVNALGGNLEGIFYCPHGPHDGCQCRKPKPGLLTTIAATYGISLANVPFIGDSLRDIEAAKASHALPMLVRTGKGEKTVRQHASVLQNVPIYPDLFTLANEIIRFPLKTK